ncbi:conserved hypothetical protein [Magnetospirillum sp. UT-4]|nr:conserved hypothetical protein [Magnetospirillum sp. UT-4]
MVIPPAGRRQVLGDADMPSAVTVVPAQAGTQGGHRQRVRDSWTPAFAGMTGEDRSWGCDG